MYRASDRYSGEAVAIKIMDRAAIKSASIEREWTVLENVGQNEHVVEFKGAFITPTDVSFVLEMCVRTAALSCSAAAAQRVRATARRLVALGVPRAAHGRRRWQGCRWAAAPLLAPCRTSATLAPSLGGMRARVREACVAATLTMPACVSCGVSGCTAASCSTA